MAGTGNKSGGFNIPDELSFLPPLYSLFFGNKMGTKTEIPSLSDYGIDKKGINSFFNLKRAISRAGIQRQGASAARSVAGSLPSSLNQSTVPASIQADIQGKIGDKLAASDAEIGGQEMQSLMAAYQSMLQKSGLEMQQNMRQEEFQKKNQFDVMDTLSLLPLFI